MAGCKALVALIGVISSLAGCTKDGIASGPTPVTVFAAASMTDAFLALKEPFAKAHPQYRLVLSFAGSQTLRLQIEQGAKADVFVSAHPQHAEALLKSGHLQSFRVFAHNQLALALRTHDAQVIKTVGDLDKAQNIVVAGDTVPLGLHSDVFLKKLGNRFGAEFLQRVQSKIVSKETNARLVRAKVQMGVAHAAIVYQSDVVAATNLVALPIPMDLQVTADLMIGRLTGAANPKGAEAFVGFVQSPQVRAILTAHRLQTPQ